MEKIFAVLDPQGIVCNLVVSKNKLEEGWIDVTDLELRPEIGNIYTDGVFSVYIDPIKERLWRDRELASTDWIVSVTDHPQHSVYLEYRQALRNWTDTPDFPETRPTLGI
jgi:hypothetical protein